MRQYIRAKYRNFTKDRNVTKDRTKQTGQSEGMLSSVFSTISKISPYIIILPHSLKKSKVGKNLFLE